MQRPQQADQFPALAASSTNLMCSDTAVRITLFGKSLDSKSRSWLIYNSLPVAAFKPSKDQRRTVNKWNGFVLGEKYKNEAARLYPVSKE
jgi:hypothetical protein